MTHTRVGRRHSPGCGERIVERNRPGPPGANRLYSRKPVPAHPSGPPPNWDLLKKDMKDTCAAGRDSTPHYIAIMGF